ncbi:DUF6179 domain-containing protein [Numidum massiliense]
MSLDCENLNDDSALAARSKINEANLQRNAYTVSLLNEGLRTGMLSSEDVYNVQHGLMSILRELISRYTKGESSSVATDTAEGIMASIMYAVDAYTLSFAQPDAAVQCLKGNDVRNVYEEGLALVSQCFIETKQLYKEIKKNKLAVPVDAYNLTIDEAFPVFMRKYGIVFEAHHTMASIDYPLAIDDMRLQGVFYMKQYLEHLAIETRFCHQFAEQDVRQLLSDYGKVCRFDYRIELFNIFRLVLDHAVFSVLSGGDANKVTLTAEQFNRLRLSFARSSDAEIRSAIHRAMARLQQELQTDPSLTAYMNECRNDLVQRVAGAANHDSLESVIITEIEEQPKQKVLLVNEADKMSDVRLRVLIEKIVRCDQTEAKVQLIRENFHSLYDYLDLLDADCLFAEEYEALFATFGDTELAIFAKIVFYEELRNSSVQFDVIVWDSTETDAEWKTHYVHFLQRLSKERLSAIETVISQIDYEEVAFFS